MAATKKIDFCYRAVEGSDKAKVYQVPVLRFLEHACEKILAKVTGDGSQKTLKDLLDQIKAGTISTDALQSRNLTQYMELLYSHLNAAGVPFPPEIPMSEFGAWFPQTTENKQKSIKNTTMTLVPSVICLQPDNMSDDKMKSQVLYVTKSSENGVVCCKRMGINQELIAFTLDDVVVKQELTQATLTALKPQIEQALRKTEFAYMLGYQPTRFQNVMGWVGRSVLWGAVASVTMMGTFALLSGSLLVFLSMAAVTATVVYAERVTAVSRWERFGAYLERVASGLYYDPMRVFKEKALTRTFWAGVLAPYLYLFSLQRSLFTTAAAIRAFSAACGFGLVGTAGGVIAFGLAGLSVLHMASLSVESISKLWGVNKTVPAELPSPEVTMVANTGSAQPSYSPENGSTHLKRA